MYQQYGRITDQTLEEAIRETLEERLERRSKKQAKSGDYRVWAAHDLAPVFEWALGVNSKDLGKNVDFLNLFASSGLELKPGDNISGLSKKSHFCSKKNRKKSGR